MRITPLFIIPIITKIRQMFHQCQYHSDCALPMVCCFGPVNQCCILPKAKLAYNPIHSTTKKYKFSLLDNPV